jgi:hypothetical protein
MSSNSSTPRVQYMASKNQPGMAVAKKYVEHTTDLIWLDR